ncbi:MAG: hypothetical protein LIO93_09270 [Bacteroidales bacterium]|nr:hypothetical protein [Bacteroidales bacterium]
MKKFFLLALSVILACGYVQAQLPEVSTADAPIWYFIQVKGGDTDRANRVFTAETDANGKDRVNGRFITTASRDNQLWRFERNGDNYVIFNKGYGKKVSLEEKVPTGGNSELLDAVTLSDTPATDWIFTLNNTRPGYANIQAVTYANDSKYFHLTSNYNQRNYPVMGYTAINDDNSVFRFVRQRMLTVSSRSLDFGNEYTNYTNLLSTAQTITVVKDPSISEEINYTTVDGFIIDGQELTTKGLLKITFAPTETKTYNGTITITAGSYIQTVDVIGIGNAHPVIPGSPEISDNTKEVWYYIKAKRSEEGKVLRDTNDETYQLRFQQPIEEDGSQLWKATGDLRGYTFTSTLGNSWYAETPNTSTKIYAKKNVSTQFTIQAFDADNNYIQSKIQGTANNYVNVSNNSDRLLGTWNTSSGFNDGGAPIAFVLAPENIFPDESDLAFGVVELGESVQKTLQVKGINLTDDMNLSFTGIGAAAYSFATGSNWDPKMGGQITITFAPEVAGDLSATLNIASGEVTKTVALSGTGSEESYLVTLNSSGVIITSPELDDNNQYSSTEVSTITFTLNEGYQNPQIASIAGATAGEITENENVYSVTLSDIQDGAIVSIEATIIPLNVTLTKNESVNWSGTPEPTVNYFDTYSVSFTIAEGYHTPLVYVNGKYFVPTKNEEVYSIQVTDVREVLDIYVSAFTYNMLPVAGDTWVRGGVDINNNYASDSKLYIQYSTWNAPSFMRRSYLEFDATEMSAEGYEKIYLRISPESFEKGGNIALQVRSADPSTDNNAITAMTWSLNTEGDGKTQRGESISEVLSLTPADYTGANAGKSLLIDVTDFVKSKLGSIFRLQLTGNEVSGTDGFVTLYSREGIGAQKDINLVPALVFEKSSTKWEGNTDNSWSNPANWEGYMLPAEISGVIISGTATNYPAIPDATTVASLTFEEGAQADLAGSVTVTNKINVEKMVNPGVWYSVGFPFALEGAYHYSDVDGFDEFPFLRPYDGTPQSDYWLRKYNGTDFLDIISYTTGEGQIVQYPSYFNDKKITYVSNANPTVTNTEITPEENVYKLVANPTLKEMEVTSENGIYYYKYDGSKFNLIPENQLGTIQPFEAFMVVKNPTILRSSISNEEGYTDINPISRGESMDEIVETRYYNLQGIQVRKPSDSKSTDNSVYIQKEIYKSGKEITSKIINTQKK